MCIPLSVSIGDSREEQCPMEELEDAEGLLGGWGAEGDTVQGEVTDPQGLYTLASVPLYTTTTT